MNKADRFLEHLMIDFIRKGIIIGKLQRWYQKHEHSWWLKLIKWIHPNHLTLSRAVVFTPLVVYCLIIQQKTAALVFWFIGWLTDALDGPWAIITGKETALGKALDPVVDRIYFIVVIVTTLWFYPLPKVLLWSFVGALFLELVLPVLCLLAKFFWQKSIIPPHNAFGKIKTFLMGFALPIVWFFPPKDNSPLILALIMGGALLASLVNIKKNIAFRYFSHSPS